ncbi:GNAT family N-acetyltransferase [Natronoglycomyces albus]|uniref:GNAT family N-acetyltransferase n=1 Tax=Natronoglycomyces albus TaxID=2811108 RepID=A0A895XLW8_9ACTN|nr:GNAT family N-acetyltransferase [Natronoglycomyces albus]QSB03955.1 GNAT family N-acetyltransferase [Natronoglycomyces albus]
MIHLSVANLERFARLGNNPTLHLSRLQGHSERGSLLPEHVLVAHDDERDLGRIAIVTYPDGATRLYLWDSPLDHPESAPVHRVLITGAIDRARAAGMTNLGTTIVDQDDTDPAGKRAALAEDGWLADSERLELQADTSSRPVAPEVVQTSPQDASITAVMAASMSHSLDDYDRNQVAELGAEKAAIGYRDMMTSGNSETPWLTYQGPNGCDGVAALMPLDDELCLGYLGVDPSARKQGIGGKLVNAMVDMAYKSGLSKATASVAVDNKPIRATLDAAGFTTRSKRTDFERKL